MTTKRQRDIITEGGQEYRKELRKDGKFLASGEWATSNRSWSYYYPDGSADSGHGAIANGGIEFTRLNNGNLKARLSWTHAIDNFEVVRDFFIALDPYKNTFQGIGSTSDSMDIRVSGSFDPKDRTVDFIDIGPSIGSVSGSTYIRTWNFVDIC